MKKSLEQFILTAANAEQISSIEKIQELWSGYGAIKRCHLAGSEKSSVIIKHVSIPKNLSHPRGWNSSFSHKRKMKSYQVEMAWYAKWSSLCTAGCYVPKCYAQDYSDDEFIIVLEDLDSAGYTERKTCAPLKDMKPCLNWLAHFHAAFLGHSPEQLWETGTYWHLETRPHELAALKDQDLKNTAKAIDLKLQSSPFQTFVHGDAKLANFCFSKDGNRTAAVDFQYVGGGCGMKDIAYFIGSCLDEVSCERYVEEILNYYFAVLADILRAKRIEINIDDLVADWRALYPAAWADFHRFLKGWSPGHWKLNSYSERITREVIDSLYR